MPIGHTPGAAGIRLVGVLARILEKKVKYGLSKFMEFVKYLLERGGQDPA